MKTLQFIIGVLLNLIPRKRRLTNFFFNALARLTVSVAIESAIIKKTKGNETQIYLTLRNKKEVYSNEWHLPGSIIRPFEGPEDVMKRIAKDLQTFLINYKCINQCFFEEKRGTFMLLIHTLEVSPPPKEDKNHRWFNINDLPENLVQHHRDKIIPIVLEQSKWL